MTPSILRTAALVAKKELRDLSRDPRTLFVSIGLPLILFPLLFWMLAAWAPAAGTGGRTFRIAVHAAVPDPGPDTPRISFSVLHEGEAGDPTGSGLYDALLVPDPEGSAAGLIVYDNKNARALEAYQALSSHLQTGARALPTYLPAPLHPPAEAAGRLLLAVVLPLMIFLFSVSCPLPIAADLSSGEKERGSLEPLLSTAAPRTGIVFGKAAATIAAGFAGALAFSLGIYLSYLISPSIAGSGPYVFNLGIADLLLLLFLGFLITAIFSALELAAGIFTRSVREAQLLGMPLLVLSMGAVYAAQAADLRSASPLLPHIPLVNLALAIREIALGELRYTHAAAAVAWGILYLCGAIYLSKRMFDHEGSILKT